MQADITPLCKKGKKDIKGNYRPVSILPIYQKYLKNACLNKYHDFLRIYSKYQCGFRKGFSTQQCLLAILEKWKRSTYNSKMFGALLTDLSVASATSCS